MPICEATKELEQRIKHVESLGLPFVYAGVRYASHYNGTELQITCKAVDVNALPEELHILNGATCIHSSGFTRAVFKYVYLPDSIIHIYSNAFAVCSYLKAIRLPSHLDYVGNHAFKACEHLQLLDLRCWDGEVIPAALCLQCLNLREVWLPKQTKVIEEFAFWGCHSLARIHLPRRKIKVGKEAFFKGGVGRTRRVYYEDER